MTDAAAILQLHDLDLLLREVRDAGSRAHLAKLGFTLQGVSQIERARARVAARLERRWLSAYERALQRYGRGVVAVRERVCQGCFITLPTSAAPAEGALAQCESCGRLLYWR